MDPALHVLLDATGGLQNATRQSIRLTALSD